MRLRATSMLTWRIYLEANLIAMDTTTFFDPEGGRGKRRKYLPVLIPIPLAPLAHLAHLGS